jgi:hypothetical protein
MLGGFLLGLIVAIAEIYFLLKKLNEIDVSKTEKVVKENSKAKITTTEKSKLSKKKD